MKRFLLSLPLLVVSLISSRAYADHIYLIPNDGSGDNFGFLGYMNGHQLALGGGTTYAFFGLGGYARGSLFGGGDTLFLSPAEIWLNGSPMEFSFSENTSSIFMSSITLPTNDKSFTVPWEIDVSAVGRNFDTGETVDVGGSARGKLSFFFSPDSGLYYPGAFVQTPEPATLTLLGSGILGILGFTRKKRRAAV